MKETEIFKEAESKMQKALGNIKRELVSIRTGKATTSLLDTIKVEAYGATMAINQLASISVPEPRLIIIQPWDKSVFAAIEKAIMTSELGITPSNDGTVIRVPVPQLTEERRKDLVKVVHKLAEEGRIAMRHVRHEANDRIKAQEKNHEISEDESFKQLKKIQDLTDEYIGYVSETLKKKEEEIMEI